MPSAHLLLKRTMMFCIALAMPVVLFGCSNGFSQTIKQAFSSNHTVDYSLLECDSLWQTNEAKDVNDTAYWLHLMQCVKQFSLPQTQAQLIYNENADWASLFRRSILLAHTAGTEIEQRKLLTQFNKMSDSSPATIKPLIKLWHKSQQSQLALQAEKVKYQRLKEHSDTQIKALTEELSSVKVKLQSLTNIETEMTRKTTAR